MGEFIEVRGLTKFFRDEVGGGVCALRSIDLQIARHQFLSIVGPSGCGKTTLLHLIAGLKPYFPAEAGEIRLDGQRIEGPGADRAVVFQEYAVFPWKTVRENIELPLKLRGVPRAERRERSRAYTELVGLSGFEDKHPYQLSGGMRQRVAVARALINNPKLLLMDEPFAAVDAQTRMKLQEELTRIWEKERTTVLFVTHSVQEALFLSDRVVVLSARPGRVKLDVPVTLPRPRRWAETQSEPEFVDLHKVILDATMSGNSDERGP